MEIGRRGFLAAFAGIALVGWDTAADAKRRTRRRARGFNISTPRGTTSGSCPCNGGDVCVGPRGGRYCITSSGRKRYGV